MSYEVVHVERNERVTRLKNVRCDGCEAELQHAMGEHGTDHDGYWRNLQANDALEITLEGGYGMYFDPFQRPDPILLCKTCADRLCEEWPAFKRLIEGTYEDV